MEGDKKGGREGREARREGDKKGGRGERGGRRDAKDDSGRVEHTPDGRGAREAGTMEGGWGLRVHTLTCTPLSALQLTRDDGRLVSLAP